MCELPAIVGIISFSITRLKHLIISRMLRGNNIVGIISFSITRLKLIHTYYKVGNTKVGIISFSITRLKLFSPLASTIFMVSWNHKFLDYEIETADAVDWTGGTAPESWNHKFLDYEIETTEKRSRRARQKIVGIISFSITRLKLWKS